MPDTASPSGAEDRLILASSSPRRRQILEALGVEVDVAPADVDESPLPGEGAEDLATRLAVAKAVATADRFPGRTVIGSDTVVVLEGTTLGKPDSPEDAARMLRALRGRAHTVITAVAGARSTHVGVERWHDHDATLVWMRSYTDEEIATYVASGDPLDKAGAYAIQHPTFRPVERIEGCYLTVVGLGLPALARVLARAGRPLPGVSAAALDAICPSCIDRDFFGA